MTLEDAGCCWLPLAAARRWTEELKGFALTSVSCVNSGVSQLSHIMKICDIRRRNGGWNAAEVSVETVSPGKEIDRCVLAGDLDQAVGLTTCERALFSHTDKP